MSTTATAPSPSADTEMGTAMPTRTAGIFVGLMLGAVIGGAGCASSRQQKVDDDAGVLRDGAAASEAGPTRSVGALSCTVQQLPLGDSTLVASSYLEVSALGEGFFLAAVEGGGQPRAVSFAYEGPDGVLGAVTRTEGLAADCGVAAVTTVRPGDQLLACSAAGRDDPASSSTRFVLTPFDAGAATPGPAAPLFRVDVINQNRLSSAVSSFDGQRSVVAIGSAVVGQPVVAVVGAGGVVLGQAVTIPIAEPSLLWTALTGVPTRHAGAISLLDGNDPPIWRLLELDRDGTVVLDAAAPLPTLAGASVRAVIPSVRGFAALLVADGGATIVEIDRTQSRAALPRMVPFTPPTGARLSLGMASQSMDELLVAFLVGEPPAVGLSVVLVDSLGVAAAGVVALPGADSVPTWIPGDGSGLSFLYGALGRRSIARVSCSR